MYRTVEQSVMDRHPVFRRRGTREQGYVDGVAEWSQEGFEGLIMLVREDLRRRHDTRLVAVIDGEQAAHQRHEGLAGTDVALQEAVHLATGLEVVVYLMDDAFLRVGEVERQGFVERMKTRADQRHGEARVLLTPLHLAQDLELDVEELFEFQSRPRVLHGEGVFRKMHVDQCVRQTHQSVSLQDVRTDRVRYAHLQVGQQLRDDRADSF